MQALGYLENIASRHAELVSKYCSQGLSNLQPRYFKTRSRADPSRDDGVGILRHDTEQSPQTGALNRKFSGQAHWGRLLRAGTTGCPQSKSFFHHTRNPRLQTLI